jgi:hypothetical protein
MPTCDLTTRTKRRLLIAAPQTLKTTYGAADRDFEGTVDIGGTTYDLLRVYPDSGSSGYSNTEQDPESKGIRKGFGGYTFRTYTPHRDPKIEVTAQMSHAAYLVLLAVHEISATSGTLVTVQDFCRPELTEWGTAIAGSSDPFTTRTCGLTIINRPQVVGNVAGGFRLSEAVKFTLQVVP